MSMTFYHNPRCSKSRAALQLLAERGFEPRLIEYLKTPPDEATLRALLAKLDMTPRELMRTKEDEYGELRLDDPTLDDDALIRAMAAHPRLIERPILVNGERAVLGRPPERVLDIV